MTRQQLSEYHAVAINVDPTCITAIDRVFLPCISQVPFINFTYIFLEIMHFKEKVHEF